jgi:PmbA protein
MKYEDFAMDIVKKARKAGADEAEVYLSHGRESTVQIRLGEIEILKSAGSRGLGLRVFAGNRLGFAYTSDFTDETIDEFIKRTIALSNETSADEFNGLPDLTKTAELLDLDLFDPKLAGISTDWKIKTAKEMEKAMMDYDKRITNSDGAGVYDGDYTVVLANSHGISHSYMGTYCYLLCQPVADDQEGKKQTSFWYTLKHFYDELGDPEEVARIAAERCVRQLGAIKEKTRKCPVVYDPQVAASLLGAIAGAINGDSIFKRSSFLVDKLGEKIATDKLTVIDDGSMVRGLSSSPFDGEGVPTTKRVIIENGVLKSYLYDTYTARKAGTATTGNAQRGYSSTPSIGTHNFYLKAGKPSREEIIGSVSDGLYLTKTMGFGANTVNGDYSIGAAGMWIKDGELAYPVEEMTIAGNMAEMLQSIEMIGSDLEFRGGTNAPTIKISEMTVSGT